MFTVDLIDEVLLLLPQNSVPPDYLFRWLRYNRHTKLVSADGFTDFISPFEFETDQFLLTYLGEFLVHVTEYKDKVKKCSYEIKDNKVSGHYESYYPDGSINQDAWYEQGQRHGPIKGYYPSGRLRYLSHQRHGVPHGLYQHYQDEDPLTIDYEVNYVDGMPDQASIYRSWTSF
ncbi:MAG: toxin-antitoxin system YwqK family antitoxin [Nitrososphaerales archaeon]